MCGQLGKVGNGLQFDGVNDYVNFGDPSDGSLDFGSSNFSLSAWIKAPSSATGYRVIFSKTTYWGSGGYDLVLADGILRGRVECSSLGDFNFPNSPDLRDGNLHHVAMTVERGSPNIVRGTLME